MSITRTKTKVRTIISHDDAITVARNYNHLLARISKLKAAMAADTNKAKAKQDEAILKIRQKHEPAIKELEEASKNDMETLQLYAEQYRDTWDAKSKDLSYAVIGFRTGQRAVEIKDAGAVVERLKKAGLKKFIRVKEEVNKLAILSEKNEAIINQLAECDITVKQDETFYVEVKE